MKIHRPKFRIDSRMAIELLSDGYGLKVQVMNGYQFRLRQEETNTFWDWYHTRGTVMLNENSRSYRWPDYIDPELLAIAIIDYIYKD